MTTIVTKNGVVVHEVPGAQLPVQVQVAAPTENTKSAKMKKWADNGALVQYHRLIDPLKSIIDRGYRLIRRDVKSFDYDGYNIGKEEQHIYPSPKTQFSEEFLENRQKKGINLIDVVLNVTFLLGVEQGRRTAKVEQQQTNSLLDTLENYRNRNKELRARCDELEAMLAIKQTQPDVDNDCLRALAQEALLQKRPNRVEEMRAELALDPTRSSFRMVRTQRVKFGELVELAKTLNKKTCSLEDWLDILKDHGWTAKEWLAKCEKKNVKTAYN